jgi:hypothetical protein
MTMMELECSSINMLFESRPRSKAMKFGVNVGGLHLRDKLLDNSVFPNIIAPQPKVSQNILNNITEHTEQYHRTYSTISQDTLNTVTEHTERYHKITCNFLSDYVLLL